MSDAVLEMRSIGKRFPGVIANDGVDFTAKAGEIHALLGENGAGKSTLMSILSGLYRPDEGEIRIKGEKVTFRSPRDAMGAGVGMIHQHFKLIPPFTVAENIVLGVKGTPQFMKKETLERKVAALAEKFGLETDPSIRIAQLSVGEQQRVEILKVLYRGADILILDEPTTVLTPQEVGELFKIMRSLAKRGCAVIVITHKLDEVMEIADKITVLRKGRLVGVRDKKATNEKELAEMMVGREVLFTYRRGYSLKGDTLFEMTGVSAMGDQGKMAVSDVSLDIREGEILAVAGVAGNGQRELAETIAGLRRGEAGQMKLFDGDITSMDVRGRIRSGIRFVPEDRLGMGLVGALDAVDNLLLKDYNRPEYSKGVWLNRRHAQDVAVQLVEKFDVSMTDVHAPVRLMSGGNMQKLLFAREVTAADTKLLIASYPVRGLDIGATENVYNLLLRERERGRGVVFISEDLDAIFSIADRIAVLFAGKLMGVVDVHKTNIEELGRMMAGLESTEAAV